MSSFLTRYHLIKLPSKLPYRFRNFSTPSTFQQWRLASNSMATPSKIYLTVKDTGVFKFSEQTPEGAAKASQALQKNHDNFHIYFNKNGFHNHIAHGVLTLYALGASASVIEKHYNNNASYQRTNPQIQKNVVEDLALPANFKKYLGDQKYYHDFLAFFQQEFEKKGWENALKEYVFAGDERADDMLGRLYAGLLHPLIHLGFGIEFNQPAIMAEALAQAAIHDSWITPYLFDTEKASTEAGATEKTLPTLLEEIKVSPELSKAAHWNDANKVRDGILARAPDSMIAIAKQWTVTPAQLEVKTAEMISTAIFYTAAAQRPDKQVKFDFYFIHCVNSSIFFPTLNALPWLSADNKVRLLKFKAYIDLAMYASCACPRLYPNDISDYVPKQARDGQTSVKEAKDDWDTIFKRLWEFEDDGHAPKLGRAVAFGQQAMKEFEDQEWARIRGDMWLNIGNMVVDSVEDTGNMWVRSAGFEEAWSDYGGRTWKGNQKISEGLADLRL